MIESIPAQGASAVATPANANQPVAASDLFAALIALLGDSAPPAQAAPSPDGAPVAEPIPPQVSGEERDQDEGSDELASDLAGALAAQVAPAPLPRPEAAARPAPQAASVIDPAPGAERALHARSRGDESRAADSAPANLAPAAAQAPAAEHAPVDLAARELLGRRAAPVHADPPAPAAPRSPGSPPRVSSPVAPTLDALPLQIPTIPRPPDRALEPLPAEAATSAGDSPARSSLPQPVAAAPAPSSEATPAAPPRESALPVIERVTWLAEQGGGQARLELSPPELGRVEIVVRVRGRRVEVHVRAEEAAAQQVVRDSRERLADALASRDLTMDGFSVNQDGSRGDGGGSREPAREAAAHALDRRTAFAERPASPHLASEATPARAAASSAVDLRV